MGVKSAGAVGVLLAALAQVVASFRQVSTCPFYDAYLQETENHNIDMSQHLIGQGVTYASSNPEIEIRQELLEHRSCRLIHSVLGGKDEIDVLSMFEDVNNPVDKLNAIYFTTQRRLYQAIFSDFDAASCKIAVCVANTAGCQYLSLSKGTSKIHLLMQCRDAIKEFVFNKNEECTKGSEYEYKVEADYATLFTENLVLYTNNKKLALLNTLGSSRKIFVNIDQYLFAMASILVTYPYVITLEEITNEVHVMIFDQVFEDLYTVSKYRVPTRKGVQQLYLTTFEPNTFLAVESESDKVFVYDIQYPETPKLCKVYHDPDFVMLTALPMCKSRVAMSANYIVLLIGTPGDLVLRAINRQRGNQNYIAADIPLGSIKSHASVSVFDYFASTFIVDLENRTRTFGFHSPRVRLNGTKLNKYRDRPTELAGTITAFNQFSSNQTGIKVIVYPIELEYFPVIKSYTPPRWLGYQGHTITIPLSSYYLGSAIVLNSTETQDNLQVTAKDKVGSLSQINKYSNLTLAKAVIGRHGLLVCWLHHNRTRMQLCYDRIIATSPQQLRIIDSIDYEINFEVSSVAFSPDLLRLFVLAKFDLKTRRSYLIYYVGFDSKIFHFVDDSEVIDQPVEFCDSIKMIYVPAQHYLFSAFGCDDGPSAWYIIKYSLNPTSPTSVLSRRVYKIDNKDKLVDFYAESHVYSAFIIRRGEGRNAIYSLLVSDPYLQNEYHFKSFQVENCRYYGSYFSETKVLLLLYSYELDHIILKEYSIAAAASPVHKRDIPVSKAVKLIPKPYSKQGGVISSFADGVLVFLIENDGSYYFLVYNLEEVEHNALYAASRIEKELEPISLEAVKSNEAVLELLLFTKKSLLHFSLSKRYNAEVTVAPREGPEDNYKVKFIAHLNSQTQDLHFIHFPVEVEQIPKTFTFNLTLSEVSVPKGAAMFNLSSIVSGYDLYFINDDQIKSGLTLSARETVSKNGKFERMFESFVTEVESVLPLEDGTIICIKNGNNIHTLMPNKGEVFVQTIEMFNHVSVTYLSNVEELQYFALSNNEVDYSLTINQQNYPSITLGWMGKDKNMKYCTHPLITFNEGEAQFMSIQKILFEPVDEIMYVILTPTASDSTHAVPSSCIAVINSILHVKYLHIRKILRDIDFSDFVNVFHVTDAIIVEHSLIAAVEDYGLINITSNKRETTIDPIPINEEYSYFAMDQVVTEMQYKQSRLYLMYRSGGLKYATLGDSGKFQFSTVPIGRSEAELTHLHVGDKYVLMSQRLLMRHGVLLYKWEEERLVPVMDLKTYDICSHVRAMWLGSGASEESSGHIYIFLHCDSTVYLITVNKWAELLFDYQELPKSKIKAEILVHDPTLNMESIITVLIDNEEGYSEFIVGTVIGIVAALLLIALTVVWYKRKRKRKLEQQQVQSEKFLFGASDLIPKR